MTSGQKRLPICPSKYKFARYGECGAEVSELLPHTAGVVDDLAIIRTLHTEAINHDPAITFIQTGAEQPGRPSLGAWLSYGLGGRTRICPPSWCCTRPGAPSATRRLSTPGCGEQGSCPRGMRACRYVRPATRCST